MVRSERTWEEGASKRCCLLDLPSVLLGRVWPSRRAVLGLKVCRQLREELAQHVSDIYLESKRKVEASEDQLTKDLKRLSNCVVSLRCEGDSVQAERLLTCVQSNLTLRRLEFNGNNIGDTGAQNLAEILRKPQHCHQLSFLDLSCNMVGNDGVSQLSAVLGACAALNHLDLGCNAFGDAGATHLSRALAGCTALTRLELPCNRIQSAGSCLVLEALRACTELQYLDLSCNSVGDDGAGRLATLLRECAAVVHLGLSCSDIGNSGAESLTAALEHKQALTHLDLSCNSLEYDGVQKLTKALMRCPLEHLDLNSMQNALGADAATSLSTVLHGSHTLRHLDLSGNLVGDDGAQRLSAALPTSLVHLDLGNNSIGDRGALWLANALAECGALVHLDLSYNKIGEDGAEALSGLVLDCTGLTDLDLDNNLCHDPDFPAPSSTRLLTDFFATPEDAELGQETRAM